ncbi:MAG: DUF1917 domain-containing protein [Chloroflexi bacterium]|nr:MAG: DUF1917 domain-containing protein [Chloroflexota bacterium]
MNQDNMRGLDLIHLVQQARMAHDGEAMPSRISGVYWIEAKPQNQTRQPTRRAGAWICHVTIDQVDTFWQQVKAATQNGQLGYKAKVCTSAPPGAPSDIRPIYICTYDAEDSADVERVRQHISDLGLNGDWHYQLLR